MDKVVDSKRSRIDTLEGEIFLLEGRFLMLDATTNIPCFRAEENVKNELDAVDLLRCQRSEPRSNCMRRILTMARIQ